MSSGSLIEIQHISPGSELLSQIWFNKIPSWYNVPQGHCSKSLPPAMLLLSQHVSPLLIYSCSFYFSLFFSPSMQLSQKQKEKLTYFSMCLHGEHISNSPVCDENKFCEDIAQLLIMGGKISFPDLERWSFTLCPPPPILKPSCLPISCLSSLFQVHGQGTYSCSDTKLLRTATYHFILHQSLTLSHFLISISLLTMTWFD